MHAEREEKKTGRPFFACNRAKRMARGILPAVLGLGIFRLSRSLSGSAFIKPSGQPSGLRTTGDKFLCWRECLEFLVVEKKKMESC